MFTQNFKIYNIVCGSTYINIFNLETEKYILKYRPNYNSISTLIKICNDKDRVPNELYDRFIYEV